MLRVETSAVHTAAPVITITRIVQSTPDHLPKNNPASTPILQTAKFQNPVTNKLGSFHQ